MPIPKNRFKGLQHIAIKVSDIETSLDFYLNVLGFTVSERHEPGDHPIFKSGLCFLRCGPLHHDLNLVFFPEIEKEKLDKIPKVDHGSTVDLGVHHFAFQVDNLQEFRKWEKWITENNIDFVRGPVVHSPTHPEGDGTWGENRAMYFCDPDGHRIEIFCDMAELDVKTNTINKSWNKARLTREGF